MGEVRQVSCCRRQRCRNFYPQEHLIEVFKTVGQVVGFRCDSRYCVIACVKLKEKTDPSHLDWSSTEGQEGLEDTDFVNSLVRIPVLVVRLRS